jgi:hypothetical protein
MKRETAARVRRLARTATIGLALLGAACGEKIVDEGVARAAIVIPKSAPAEILTAARELQTYVQRTSGAQLVVRDIGTRGPEAVEIRLGVERPQSRTEGPADPGPRHADGYAIHAARRTITITGGSPRGTLYGAYAFIERVLGVRWFMPTGLGEDVLEARTIPVPNLDLVHDPGFDSIGGFAWQGGPGALEWASRMRARVGPPVSFGHNWENILRLTPESLERHPEAFALVGGKRGGSNQLCTTDPTVVEATIAAARAWFDAHPESPLFSISPNDGSGFCECDRCRKIDALYDARPGQLADRFTHYANEVLAALAKTHPGRQVGILAYDRYTAPPQQARPASGYATLVTHMPWEFCHVHAIGDPSCPTNRRYLEYLRGWTRLTKHTGVYEYYGHFLVMTPWPIVPAIRRDIPLLHSMGLERFESETQQNWATQGLNFYVAAKLADDPSIDVDALLADYYARFYGPAAEPMRRYAGVFEGAMRRSTQTGDGGFTWVSMFTPALVAEAGTALAQAEVAARRGPEKFISRVAFARLGFAYTEAFAMMLDAGQRRDVRGVLEWSARAEDRLKAAEGSAPQAFVPGVGRDATRYWTRLALSGSFPWKTAAGSARPSPTTTPTTTP